MKIAIRGFKRDRMIFEEDGIDVANEQLESFIRDLVGKHARLLASGPHTIELEFLDRSQEAERFFCFGTDALRLSHPLIIDLDDGRTFARGSQFYVGGKHDHKIS
jgi:hypothetical protein